LSSSPPVSRSYARNGEDLAASEDLLDIIVL
jgi:hypothetical protein